MFSDAFFGTVALLYYLCFLLLAALAACIAFRGSRRTRARFRLRRTFFLLALSLLVWQITMFAEVRAALPALQLWLGRANFAAVVFAAYFALRFVQEVAVTGSVRWPGVSSLLLAETCLLASLTLLTRLVDAAECVEAGHAITTFGWLFPGYLLHVIGYLGAVLVVAFRERRRTDDSTVRAQLTLIGLGMLATGGVAVITNAVLPYAFGEFRYCDLGTLSALAFVLAVAYATFVNRLFDLRIMFRGTLVYGVLLAFVLGAYSSAVFVISQHLTESTEKLTQFAVLLIAFTFDPLRRFLEEKTDRWLFGERDADGRRGNQSRKRRGSRLNLALLFPWRHR
jgi:hypothetical protein